MRKIGMLGVGVIAFLLGSRSGRSPYDHAQDALSRVRSNLRRGRRGSSGPTGLAPT